MKTNSTNRHDSVCALAVGDFQMDRVMLREIFRECGWRLVEAADRQEAVRYLSREAVQVVIAESNSGWTWRTVLNELRDVPNCPYLVVASRIADDSLWAEALNMGAYDVLAQPFYREEVERVVASAARRFQMRTPGAATAATAAASAA